MQAVQQNLGFGGAEIAGAAIPGQGGFHIAAHAAKVSMVEKDRVEGLAHPDRCLGFTGIGCPLIKQACRSEVARAEKNIAAGEERCELRGGEPRLYRRWVS